MPLSDFAARIAFESPAWPYTLLGCVCPQAVAQIFFGATRVGSPYFSSMLYMHFTLPSYIHCILSGPPRGRYKVFSDTWLHLQLALYDSTSSLCAKTTAQSGLKLLPFALLPPAFLHPSPRTAQRLMDMINVEAAFVILSNATDPELASAWQQNPALRRRIHNIISRGPPTHGKGNAPLYQHQASQRPAQQVLRGWPDGPMPAMSAAPTAPAAQFGGSGGGYASHSSARSWADMSETQSDTQGAGAGWAQQDPRESAAQQDHDP